MKIAVVLTFESLPLRFLGCYGCLEHNTPCWNRLASESVLFDRHFAENLDPAAKNHAWWTGRSQSFRTHAEQHREGNLLTDALRRGGVASNLIVETAVTASSEMPAGFDTLTVSSENRSGIGITGLIDAAVSCLRVAGVYERRSQLFWFKAAGLETDDAETDSADDPAEHALAARLQIQDRELGRLCDAVRQIASAHRDVELLFIVTAAEGEMHGEQPHLPAEFQRLGEAVVHTPLLIQATNGDAGSRRRAFVQPVDLVPTLLDWFGWPAGERAFDGQSLLPFVRLESRETASPLRRKLIVSGDGRRVLSIRTQDHYLIAPFQSAAHSAATLPQLFHKPEDVWEVNDVAKQDPETVAELQSLLASATNAGE